MTIPIRKPLMPICHSYAFREKNSSNCTVVSMYVHSSPAHIFQNIKAKKNLVYKPHGQLYHVFKPLIIILKREILLQSLVIKYILTLGKLFHTM